MPNWLVIVLLLLAVFAVAMARERWRLTAMEKWTATRGLAVLSPFVPGDRPEVARLATRFDVRGGRIWGAAVAGRYEGVEVTLAEHETTPPGKKTGVWQTLIVWAVSGADSPIVLWPRARGWLDSSSENVLGGSSLRVGERISRPDDKAEGLREVTEGGLLVEGVPEVRRAWLTPGRRDALESWPHGGNFAVERGVAAWRVEGLLTPSRLETLLDQLREARRIIG